MNLKDRIDERVRRLPEPLQAEVLRFIDFLLDRFEDGERDNEPVDWSSISLSLALSDMDDEEHPAYSVDDIIEQSS